MAGPNFTELQMATTSDFALQTLYARLAPIRDFAHNFRDLEDRTAFINHMKERGIGCVFHYVPLHSSPAGKRFGRMFGEDRYTTSEGDRLVRLPMYYGMTDEDRSAVIEAALAYFA